MKHKPLKLWGPTLFVLCLFPDEDITRRQLLAFIRREPSCDEGQNV